MRTTAMAVAVVLVANVVAIGPAMQERAAPVGRATVTVCGQHLVGGWRDGELPMLTLPLETPVGGWGEVIPPPTLVALGFDPADLTAIGDSLWTGGAWPAPRRAWLTLRQATDSGYRYRVTGAHVARPTAAPGELVAQGLVAIDRIWSEVKSPSDSTRPPQRTSAVGVQILRLLPPQLGLDRSQSAQLKRLQGERQWECTETIPVTLAFGSRGALWVESVSAPR
jgi:hypothetical protein